MIKYLFTYYNPTNGLKVECTVKGYPSYQAAEWVLNFTNKGTEVMMDQDIKTVIQYPVGATEFDIPFDYLSRKFVRGQGSGCR